LSGINVAAADVPVAADYAVAALTVVENRAVDWRLTLVDTVADNGSAAFFVLRCEQRRIDIDQFGRLSCGMAALPNRRLTSQRSGAVALI